MCKYWKTRRSLKGEKKIKCRATECIKLKLKVNFLIFMELLYVTRFQKKIEIAFKEFSLENQYVLLGVCVFICHEFPFGFIWQKCLRKSFCISWIIVFFVYLSLLLADYSSLIFISFLVEFFCKSNKKLNVCVCLFSSQNIFYYIIFILLL